MNDDEVRRVAQLVATARRCEEARDGSKTIEAQARNHRATCEWQANHWMNEGRIAAANALTTAMRDLYEGEIARIEAARAHEMEKLKDAVAGGVINTVEIQRCADRLTELGAEVARNSRLVLLWGAERALVRRGL